MNGFRLSQLEECVKPLPALQESVRSVREEHVVHSQYAAAMENLKHIFTVPESVEKTKQWIQEGKLLHAHQSLTDLENSRDDLLYEIHRLPSHSLDDAQMLKVGRSLPLVHGFWGLSSFYAYCSAVNGPINGFR